MTTLNVLLTMRHAFQLRTRVLDPAGVPVSGAAVTLRSAALAGEARIASTDATGIAAVSALLPGWYSVTASDVAGRQAARDVEVTSDQTVDVTLQSDATLVVRDRGDDGEASWTLLIAHWPSLDVVSEQQHDRGTEAVLRLPAADYLVMAQRGPATMFARSVRLRGGSESTLDLSLRDARSVQLEQDELWDRKIAAPLVCRVVPRSMIDSAAPLTYRLRPLPMSSSLRVAVSGDNLLAWCVGDPATVSDGVAALDRTQSRVTVVVPDSTRAPPYLVRKTQDGHVIERVLTSAGTLRAGDVVISIDGRSVAGLTTLGLGYALASAPPGVHTVAVMRDGASVRATLCMEACGASE